MLANDLTILSASAVLRMLIRSISRGPRRVKVMQSQGYHWGKAVGHVYAYATGSPSEPHQSPEDSLPATGVEEDDVSREEEEDSIHDLAEPSQQQQDDSAVNEDPEESNQYALSDHEYDDRISSASSEEDGVFHTDESDLDE